MNATLKESLTWLTTGTYNDLVNAAIVQEGAMHQVEEEDRKRKAPASASAAPTGEAPPDLHFTTGQRFRASPQQQYQQRYGLLEATTAIEVSTPCTIPAARKSECSCPTAY
ncbi:hypothetical protein PR202_gb29177 [Eleusine coracana subsp. coracana]|uniref:Uncharacterized protein n=1 Tax=Eleusine coracana subsp. coracana TaxID=191504 RepID=A0AAV5FYB3_ELECO|nr:hypothetical protein PR202_gb29177 [Eleusine coracana subsp. coracana]